MASSGAAPLALAALLGAVLAGVLVWAVLSLPPVLGPLPAAVVARLPEAGVAHPVTGVLLAFRAWDTLLEIAVLAAAWLAARSLAPETAAVAEPVAPLLAAMTRILLPLLVVVAGYLLWRGSHAPGGAFQAGALLAAGGVLGSLCRMCWPLGWRLPIALGLGVAVFLGVGLATLASGRAFLEYPPALAGGAILAIETAATVSIGATLATLFDPGLLR
jgi:multisubunit Na+/H+ antiporter MnhB subunit